MWIILKIDNQLFKMINTDVCACFQNENGELGFEHGNYHHTIPTTDIADVQDILDYIAYCLKQKQYICEIPSAEYNIWRSRFIRKKDLNKIIEEVNKAPVTPIPREGNDYITTYRGIPIEELQKAYEELQKAYEESVLYKEYKEIIDKWTEAGFINPITSEEIKKIKEQEEKDKKISSEEKVKEIWVNYDNTPIRTPHCGHKISNEEREEAIKRAIAKAYLFDKKNQEQDQLKKLERSARNIINENTITIYCSHCGCAAIEDSKDAILKKLIDENDNASVPCPRCKKEITKKDRVEAIERLVEWYKNLKPIELSQEEKNYLDNYINSIPHYDD